jgi:hypothetical protein
LGPDRKKRKYFANMEGTMKNNTTPPFEIPTDMHKMTEQSLAQVRRAIDAYIQFLQRAIPEDIMGGSEPHVCRTYAERNLANAFEFGQRLMLVRDVPLPGAAADGLYSTANASADRAGV